MDDCSIAVWLGVENRVGREERDPLEGKDDGNNRVTAHVEPREPVLTL